MSYPEFKMPSSLPLLDIKNLSTSFYTDDIAVKAVRGVDLQLKQGETLAIVGESGCGKSVTALSILRLLSMPPGHFDSGSIKFNGKKAMGFLKSHPPSRVSFF